MTTKMFSTSAMLLIGLILVPIVDVCEGSSQRQPRYAGKATSRGSVCGSSNLNATDESSISLHSPNYPKNYPPDSDCWWTITAPLGYRVLINFITFELETCCDFLVVYNTPSQAQATQRHSIISNRDVSSGSLLSDSNYITMRFTSNWWYQRKGFKLTTRATAGKIDCPTLPAPSNGGKVCYVSNNNTFYCKFSCNIDFKLSGNERRWCQSIGTWTGNQVTCEKRTCFKLPVQENGTMSCTDGIYINSKCSFTCNEGYQMFGSKSRKCERTGQWSGYDTSCQVCGPSKLKATVGSSRSLHSPNYPKTYPPDSDCWWTITAPLGYRVLINFITFELETCCDFLVLYDAPSHTQATQKYSTISYEDVSSGSIVSHSNYITMNFTSNDNWQYKGFELTYRATDIVLDCPILPAPSNGGKVCYLSKNNTFYCKFSCNTNFKLSGGERRWCKSNGAWTGNQVSCKEITSCSKLAAQENGSMSCTDGIYINSKCSFTCNEGYQMFGSKSRKCERTGQWSGYDTSCQGSPPTPTCDADRWQICDGRYDCDDRSDEMGCTCPHYKFKCDCYEIGCSSRYGCIEQSLRCNGENNCGDRSDELGCDCSDTRFQCKDGDCIDRSRVNDGNVDCVKGDDEFICNKKQSYTQCNCMHDDDRCTSSGRCIPNSWIGDTIVDCENRDDEPCSASKVWCGNSWVVINQCSTKQSTNVLLQNSRDNRTRCHRVTIPSVQKQILETNWICVTSPRGKCLELFRCDNGQFIDNEHYCDTIHQCIDGSDEDVRQFGFRCSGKYRKNVCVLPQKNVYDSVAHCADSSDLCFVNGEFRCFSCLDGKLIVSAKQVCDGIVDCYDMSDECLCANQSVCNTVLGEDKSKCPFSQMHCSSDTDCVDMTKILCNSSVHCKDEINQRFCHQDQQFSGVMSCFTRFRTYDFIDITATRCDGRPECGSMEDECDGCEPRPSFCDGPCAVEARESKFGNRVCDGYVNWFGRSSSCDQEVERNCTMRFNCKSKDMISIDKRSVCDGIFDCDDHSDENITNCGNKRFYCMKGKAFSIDKVFECDGIKDCDKNEDEAHHLCGEKRFYCKSGQPLSIDKESLNNGIKDCSNGSDECNSLFSDRYEMISSPLLRALFWIMGLLALGGNISIIFGTAKYIYLHSDDRTGYMVLILNLAICDLFMGVYLIAVVAEGVGYSGNYCFVDKEWRSSNLCTALGTIALFSFEASAFIMAALSAYRYIVICRPFVSGILKVRSIVISVCLCWILSFLLAAIPLFPFDSGYFISDVCLPNLFLKTDEISHNAFLTLAERVFENKSDPKLWFEVNKAISDAFKYNPIKGEFGYYGVNSVCMPRLYAATGESAWEYSFFLNTFNILLFIGSLAAYVLIYKALMVSSKSTQQVDSKKSFKAFNKRITRLLLTDFCCRIPVCIMGYLSAAGVSLPPEVYIASAGFLFPINSALHPILYSPFIDRQATRAKKWIIQKLLFIRFCSIDFFERNNYRVEEIELSRRVPRGEVRAA